MSPITRNLLESEEIHLIDEWENYGERAGDSQEIYSERGLIHPAVWPALANHIVEKNLVDGPWIHTRSKIFHHELVEIGSIVNIESQVVNRFASRTGNRAVINISIKINGKKAVSLEHEALVSLNPKS